MLTTLMEHHSNDLPWRGRARGRARGPAARRAPGRGAPRPAAGAARRTGGARDRERRVQRHRLRAAGAPAGTQGARGGRAHPGGRRAVGAAPARSTCARRTIPEHLDYVALSAHKLYAPFGTGALVGRRRRVPAMARPSTAAAARSSASRSTRWSGRGCPTARRRAAPTWWERSRWRPPCARCRRSGSTLSSGTSGRSRPTRWSGSRPVPGLTLYGETDARRAADRVGVIPFNLDGVPHGLVAAVLGYEAGIGVRHGCFCAQAYVAHLLGIPDAQRGSRDGRRSTSPAWCASASAPTTRREDVDALVDALLRLRRGGYRGRYERGPDGEYTASERLLDPRQERRARRELHVVHVAVDGQLQVGVEPMPPGVVRRRPGERITMRPPVLGTGAPR